MGMEFESCNTIDVVIYKIYTIDIIIKETGTIDCMMI